MHEKTGSPGGGPIDPAAKYCEDSHEKAHAKRGEVNKNKDPKR
jgi:hypothetical protein